MKKIISLLLTILFVFGLCVLPASASTPYSWVVSPNYDAIYTPATTEAPFFAYVKNGIGGYLDKNGNEIFGTFQTDNMAMAAFHKYTDGNCYAIIQESSGLKLLKSDGTILTGAEATELLSTYEIIYEAELCELITKTETGNPGGKTITYKNLAGAPLFAPIMAYDAGNFHSGFAVIETTAGKSALADATGLLTQVPDYLDLTGFYYENICVAKSNDKWGLVTLSVYPEISVKVNGNKVYFDQPPKIINDRTLVPLRAIFESLGADVFWDGATRTVTASKGESTIALTIDSKQLYINGTTKEIDVPAMILNDRTMVPARAVSESLNCEVVWSPDTRTIDIYEK